MRSEEVYGYRPIFVIIYGVDSTTELDEAQNHMQYFFMGGGERQMPLESSLGLMSRAVLLSLTAT